MAYVIVWVVALAAGVLTYWLTLRSTATEAASVPSDGQGFLPPAPNATTAAPEGTFEPPDGSYVPVSVDRRSWQTRVSGLIGLLIAISLAAALLAFALYQAGSLIARVISDFAK